MRYIKYKYLSVLLFLSLGLFTACEPDPALDVPTPTPGEADFTTFVALGNSLTAGYADGALHRRGQIASYPAMLADKIAEAGGASTFKQPLMPEGGGNNGAGSPRLVLAESNGSLLPAPDPSGASALTNVRSEGPFQNLGVPGARSFHLVTPGYAALNPFYGRMASADDATPAGDAAAQNPTFVTLWIGNNDVLGYGTSGGSADNPFGIAGNQITPTDVFAQGINGTIATLKAANPNVQGAIANIPNILDIPFFKTAAYNAFVLSAEQADQLNATFRATAEAQARPQVEAAVRAVVREQVVEAVRAQVRQQVEAAVREQVTAQVTMAVREQVTAQVTAAVRENARQQALDAGASEADADAAADAFVASPEGQATIEGAVNAQMASDEVQALIQQQVNAQMASDAVAQIIEAQLAAQMQSDTVQNIIEQQTNAQMQSPEVQAIIEAQLAAVLASLPTVSEGPNPFLVAVPQSAENPFGVRQATPEDLILLEVLGFVGSAEFQAFPVLPDRLVLDPAEQANIRNAIETFNGIIANAAQENGWALVDMNNFFDRVVTGFVFDGVTYSATFVTGGAFSLDGVHLSDRGYAIAANRFIQDINRHYNAKLAPVNVNQFDGILFP
ncbi:MAG: SGNH/GDSL hydrolase family protein [Bernardetiaceae bacterium]|nr:SGNH/GDSL hydrolase family protein [Bernardetiaceae bacterium]